MIAALEWGMALYLGGCVPAFIFFLTGCAPSLLERNWHWPVIFLWPLLPLWPLRSVFQLLRDWRHLRQNSRIIIPRPNGSVGGDVLTKFPGV